MTLFSAAGTELTETALTAQLTAITVPATFTVGEPVFEDFDYLQPAVEGVRGAGTRLKWYAGQVVSQNDVNAAFNAATIASITPTTGTTAGGTVVTIRGTSLRTTSAVKFGAVAATAVTTVDDTTVTATTPAGSAGAVTVSVTTDTGTVVSGSALYTYA